VLVTARLIDEIEREPWRRPPLEKVGDWTSPDGYSRDIEEAAPERGSADEVRQLVASRVLLLHSEPPMDREAMLVLAEQNKTAWLFDRWMPGLLADWKRVAPRIVRLLEVLEILGTQPRQFVIDAPKRERLWRELMDIDRRLVGLTLLTDRPELLVCGAGTEDSAAVREAERSNVRWLAPEHTDDDLRFMRCAAECATAAREDGWPGPRGRGLFDPMIASPKWVPVSWTIDPAARRDPPGKHIEPDS
jgi:Ribosomal protein S2